MSHFNEAQAPETARKAEPMNPAWLLDTFTIWAIASGYPAPTDAAWDQEEREISLMEVFDQFVDSMEEIYHLAELGAHWDDLQFILTQFPTINTGRAAFERWVALGEGGEAPWNLAHGTALLLEVAESAGAGQWQPTEQERVTSMLLLESIAQAASCIREHLESESR
jgi:hypothetical protein